MILNANDSYYSVKLERRSRSWDWLYIGLRKIIQCLPYEMSTHLFFATDYYFAFMLFLFMSIVYVAIVQIKYAIPHSSGDHA
jgi:hypothetical protein